MPSLKIPHTEILYYEGRNYEGKSAVLLGARMLKLTLRQESTL